MKKVEPKILEKQGQENQEEINTKDDNNNKDREKRGNKLPTTSIRNAVDSKK